MKHSSRIDMISCYAPDPAALKPVSSSRILDHAVTLVDAHVHTRYSDGKAEVRDVEDQCLRRGIGCVITDHNEIRGSMELFERQTVPTLPALEIGSREQIELLLYFRNPVECEDFYRSSVEPFRRPRFYTYLQRSLDEIVEAVRGYDALISIPHPFAPLWKNIDHGRKRQTVLGRTLAEADCVEAWNGSLTGRANDKAMLLCQNLDKIPLAGSDSHEVESIGSVVAALDAPVTGDTLFDALAEGRIAGLLGQNGRPRYLSNAWQVARRHSRKLIMANGAGLLKEKICSHFFQKTG